MRHCLFKLIVLLALSCSTIFVYANVSITTESQLRDLVAGGDYEGQIIDLDADITITGLWTPIGSAAQPFKGEFNGKGHVISGLSVIKGSQAVGLFGYVAAEAKIHDLGIGTGHIAAAKKSYVGALVGILDGAVERCWNIATIQTAGSVVGGLVGYAQSNATISHCYNAAPVLQAQDTVGGLVGWNKGSIAYAYNIGYAYNGHGFVGVNDGQLDHCYYDRQLYEQESDAHFLPAGLVAVDQSSDLMTAFANQPAWVTEDNLYPRLQSFKDHEAAWVSVAPLFLNPTGETPTNRANNLTSDFKISKLHDVQWAIPSLTQRQWLRLKNDDVIVYYPCQKTDVILQVSLNDHVRDIYTLPHTLDPFYAGTFTADSLTVCLGQDVRFADYSIHYGNATGGDKDYFYMVCLYQIVGQDTLLRDTVVQEVSMANLKSAINQVVWTPTQAGTYTFRCFAHDNSCHLDWALCNTEWIAAVYEPLQSGAISGQTHTFCDLTSSVTIPSIVNATADARAQIHYVWMVNDEVISDQTEAQLTDYPILQKGTYRFVRYAYDNVCVEVSNPLPSQDTATCIVHETFVPGQVNADDTVYLCAESDWDETAIIAGTSATGGDENYSYQWLMQVDNTIPKVIANANESYLPVGQLTLAGGHFYTFMRQAKDGVCATTWITCEGHRTYRIFGSMNAGRIPDSTLDNRCIPDRQPMDIHVQVASVKEVSGDGQWEYAWYRALADGSDEQLLEGQNAKDLDVTFSSTTIQLYQEYIFYRTVRNTACNGDTIHSSGVIRQTYITNDPIDSTIYICAAMLPYTVYYPNAEHPTASHEFTQADEVWQFIDDSTACSPLVTITLKTLLTPTIQMDTLANFCDENNQITIYFKVEKGNPDSFFIALSPDLSRYFDDKPYLEGIMDPVSEGEMGYIQLNDVHIGVGDNYMLLQVGHRKKNQDASPCLSDPKKLTIDVALSGYVHEKYGCILFVDNAPDTPDKLRFQAYQWFKNGVLQEGQTGQYYQENGQPLNGLYYVELTGIDGHSYRSCDITMVNTPASVAQHTAVYPVPVQTNAPLTIACDCGSALLVSNTGTVVMTVNNIHERAVIKAPSVPGFYTVYLTHESGQVEAHKLIVQQ